MLALGGGSFADAAIYIYFFFAFFGFSTLVYIQKLHFFFFLQTLLFGNKSFILYAYKYRKKKLKQRDKKSRNWWFCSVLVQQVSGESLEHIQEAGLGEFFHESPHILGLVTQLQEEGV